MPLAHTALLPSSHSAFDRSKLPMWLWFGVIALALIASFTWVVSKQSQRAANRDAIAHAHSAAFSACLETPGSTIGECRRDAAARLAAPDVINAAGEYLVRPVNVGLR